MFRGRADLPELELDSGFYRLGLGTEEDYSVRIDTMTPAVGFDFAQHLATLGKADPLASKRAKSCRSTARRST